MSPEAAAFLTSARGQGLVDAAAATAGRSALERPRALAGRGTPEEVRLALTQADLRVRAAAKTPHATRLLFTPEALEQATPWPVAAERARRWPLAAGERVADLGAGVGFDALALAEAGRPVLAVERDPARARLLAFNVEALGLEGLVEVRCADLASGPFEAAGAFLDPDRRPGGRRTRDAEQFEPPASAWAGLLAPYRAVVVKAPPVATPGLPEDAPFEVVSLDGELRERRLLLRGFAGAPPRRALALPSGNTVAGTSLPWPEPRAPFEGAWLLDPDPCVTVAGLVGDLCAQAGLAPVHPRIAYLVADAPRPTAPGTWLAIEALLPPDARTLNDWLAAQRVGRLTLRARGVEDTMASWRRRLKTGGPGAATLVFTRGPDDRWVVLGAREERAEPGPGRTPDSPR